MFKSVNGGKLPTKGSKFSACVDLYAREDVVVGVGETKLIPLGVCIDLEALKEIRVKTLQNSGFANAHVLDEFLKDDYERFLNSHYLQLMLRSSLGKKGLILPNGVGIIDLDYKDEIKMIIHNPLTPYYVEATTKMISIASVLQRDGFSEDEIIDAQKKLLKKIGYSTESFTIKKGDKIGQITLLEHKSYLFGVESDVERDGGFGSTGES